MGIVKRQNFKNNILSFAGVGIALLSTILVYPLALEAYGISQTLLSIAMLLMPFLSLGTASISIRYFPAHNKSEESRKYFFSLLFYLTLLGSIIVPFIVWFLFLKIEPLLPSTFDFSLVKAYRWVLFGLAVCATFTQVLAKYAANFQRIVVPAAFTNLLPKIISPLLVYAFVLGWMNLEHFLFSYVVLHISIVFALSAYLAFLNEFRLSKRLGAIFSGLNKDMVSYATYSILTALGSLLVLKIDIVMVQSLMGNEAAGIYQIAIFAAMVIDIPLRSTVTIVAPLIAAHWAKEDMRGMEDLYKRSSGVLTAVGLVIAVLIITSISNVFDLTAKPEALKTGYWALVLVCMGKVVDLAFSVSDHIIGLSPRYTFRLFTVLLLGGINVLLNYYFVSLLGLGLTGAGLATMISLIAYSLAKGLFIRYFFGMNPLSLQSIYAVFWSIVVFSLLSLIPDMGLPLIEIILKTSLGGVGFFALFYYTSLVPDIQSFLKIGLSGLNKYLKGRESS